MDLPVYKITKDKKYSANGEELGMDMFAHLENPAILTKGFAFSEAKKQRFEDQMKLRVVAPLMIPDKPIYRSDEDGEYFVVFENEVVEELWVDFMDRIDQGKVKQKTNLDHETFQKPPSYVLYAWRVGKDTKADAAWSEYGIDVPEGTIMVITQFRDKEYFKREILDAGRTGYSIEGYLGLKLSSVIKEKFSMKNNKKVKRADFKQIAQVNKWYYDIDQESIIEGLKLTQTYKENDGTEITNPLTQGEYLDEEGNFRFLVDTEGIVQKIINNNNKFNKMEKKFKFMSVYLEDGTPIWIDHETLEVYTMDENMEKQILADGTYKTADGIEIIVAGGKVDKLPGADAPVAEPSTETAEPIAQAKEEVKAEEIPVAPEAPAEAISVDEAAVLAIVQPKLDELMRQIADLKVAIEANQPAAEPSAEQMSMSNQDKPVNQKAFALSVFNKFRSEY